MRENSIAVANQSQIFGKLLSIESPGYKSHNYKINVLILFTNMPKYDGVRFYILECRETTDSTLLDKIVKGGKKGIKKRS